MANIWRKPFDSEQKACPPGEVQIDSAQCKGCGYCVIFCPKKCLSLSVKFNKAGHHPAELSKKEPCSACGTCYIMCPDVAITLNSKL